MLEKGEAQYKILKFTSFFPSAFKEKNKLLANGYKNSC